jgi:protein ImuB
MDREFGTEQSRHRAPTVRSSVTCFWMPPILEHRISIDITLLFRYISVDIDYCSVVVERVRLEEAVMVNGALFDAQAGIQLGFWYPLEERVVLQEEVSVSRSAVKLYACVQNRTTQADRSLIELVSNFSSLIEETTPDTVVLDVTGSESLFGPPEQLSEDILVYLTRNGLDASIAVASNPDAAILAARNLPGITILDSTEYRRLSKLPLTALDPILAGVKPDRAEAILDTLDLWGLHTFSDLAGLPEKGVAETLGPEGIALRQLALGIHRRPLNFIKPEIAFEEILELDYPIEMLDQLSFAVTSLIDALCSRLSRYGLATTAIKLAAELEDDSKYERQLGLPFPMSSAHWISRLLLFEIESSPPSAAIKSLRFSAEPARPRSMQEGLFEPVAPEPEKLEMTLARLGRLVGRNNIGSPDVLDDHYPDAFRVKSFMLVTKKRRPPSGAGRKSRDLGEQFVLTIGDLPTKGRARRAAPTSPFQTFRMLRPPLPAKVEAESGRLKLLKIQEDHILRGGRIIRESGPWKVSGRWWSDPDHWDREEWDVTLSTGSLYRIFRDPGRDQWCVDGVYD